jgi:hypothetical protein
MEKFIDYKVNKKEFNLHESDYIYTLHIKQLVIDDTIHQFRIDTYAFQEIQKAVGFSYKLAKKSGYFGGQELEYSFKGEYISNCLNSNKVLWPSYNSFITKQQITVDQTDGHLYHTTITDTTM